MINMMFGLVDLFLQAEITLPRQKDTAPIPIVFKKSRRFKFTLNSLEYVFKSRIAVKLRRKNKVPVKSLQDQIVLPVIQA